MLHLRQHLQDLEEALEGHDLEQVQTLAEAMTRAHNLNAAQLDDARGLLVSVIGQRYCVEAAACLRKGGVGKAAAALDQAVQTIHALVLGPANPRVLSLLEKAQREATDGRLTSDAFSELAAPLLGGREVDIWMERIRHDVESGGTRLRSRKSKTVIVAHPGAVAKEFGDLIAPSGAMSRGESLGGVLLHSLLRPRVVITAAVFFALALAWGFYSQEQNYETRFSMLRPGSVSDGSTEFGTIMPRLPKEELRRLPSRPEVRAALAQALSARLDGREFTASDFGGRITTTVDVGDYGGTDFVVNVTVSHPDIEVVQAAGEVLPKIVTEHHASIVTADLEASIRAYGSSAARAQQELREKQSELAKRAKGGHAPAGDYQMRMDTLIKLYVFAKQGLQEAETLHAGERVGASLISSALEGEQPFATFPTGIQGSQVLALQPLFMELVELFRRRRELETKLETAGAGDAHPARADLASVQMAIEELQADIAAQQESMGAGPGEEHRANAVHDRLKVESTLRTANRDAAQQQIDQWRKFQGEVLAEFDRLAEGDGEVARLTAEAEIARQTWTDHGRRLRDLTNFRDRKPGHLAVVSRDDAPSERAGGHLMVVLTALAIGIAAGALAAFTGGHKALHAIALGALGLLTTTTTG